jgi:aspartyl-tRNA(Asn)/glutamyl-tRNA(Gln) amidotransferase subunit B
MGLSEADAEVLTLELPIAEYFEAAIGGGNGAGGGGSKAGAGAKALPPREVAKRVLREIMAKIKDEGIDPADLERRYPSRLLHGLVGLQLDGTISGASATEVFETSWARAKGAEPGEADPAAIVAERGLGQISDESAIVAAVEQVIAANPKQVEQYRAGKQAVIGFLVGQVMKATGGRANPALVNKIFAERLTQP